MRTYLIKRIMLFFPTLILLTIIVFAILRVVPGDPALLELKRTWKYRRLTIWAKKLTRKFQGLVDRSRSC